MLSSVGISNAVFYKLDNGEYTPVGEIKNIDAITIEAPEENQYEDMCIDLNRTLEITFRLDKLFTIRFMQAIESNNWLKRHHYPMRRRKKCNRTKKMKH